MLFKDRLIWYNENKKRAHEETILFRPPRESGIGMDIDLLFFLGKLSGRWPHHVTVGSTEEIDGELTAWIWEAAGFSQQRGKQHVIDSSLQSDICL